MTTDPRKLVRLALMLGVVFSIVFLVWALLFHTQDISLVILGFAPLPLALGCCAAFGLGMGLGTMVVLFVANRHRLRAVFRPNKGRVICAAVMSLLAPLQLVGPFPMTGIFYMAGYASILGGLLVLILMVFWYPISCVIISGVDGRRLRVAIFGQMWLANYSAMLFTFGLVAPNM